MLISGLLEKVNLPNKRLSAFDSSSKINPLQSSIAEQGNRI